MILADTSVWIDHLRSGEPQLSSLLDDGSVLMHPFVLGEMACGNLRNRKVVLELLADLPHAIVATEAEVLDFIEHHFLMGRGIGYVDAHLLASVSLSDSTRLWTRDRRLEAAAETLDVSFTAN